MMDQICLLVCLLVLPYGLVDSDSCSRPTIENGQILKGESSTEHFYGLVVCDTGFHLMGHTPYVRCQNGYWSPLTFPRCSAIGICPELPKLINGQSVPIRGSRGSAYKFKCNRGYKRFGEGRTGCDGSKWSHRSSPVCTAVGCDETGMLDIPYGEGRSMMGGAVYKYRCNSGIEIKGAETVYCDGNQWNGTVPHCLVSPSSPSLSLIVSGQIVTSVRPGDWLLVTCQATGGNPVPDIGLTVDGLPVPGMSKDFRSSQNSFTFTVASEDHGKTVECISNNKAGSGHTSTDINVDAPPMNIELIGPEVVAKGEQVHYECKYDGGRPTPTLSWNVNNRYVGSEPNLVVTPSSENKKLEISCHAENPYGKISHTKSVNVHYLPESVVVTGPQEGVVGELLILTCTSYPSYPTPSLKWRLVMEGKFMEVRNEEAAINKQINEDKSVIATANLTLKVDKDLNKIVVMCGATIDGLSGEITSLEHLINVKKSMTQPVIRSLGDNSSLQSGIELNLTCTTSYTPSFESVVWSVNEEVMLIDKTPMKTNEEMLVSSWIFIPSSDDKEIECKAVGDQSLSEKVSINVQKSMTHPIIIGLGDSTYLESGVKVYLTCITTYTPRIEEIVWLIDGLVMKSDRSLTMENEERLVSSWSFIPFDEDKEIECQVVGDQTLSERVNIYVKKSTTKPIINGIKEYSSLEAGVEVNLTCETSYTPSIESIIWVVNGEEMKTENISTVKIKFNEKIISLWSFTPFAKDQEIECKVIGDQTFSEKIQFNVKNSMTKPTIYGLGDASSLESGVEINLTCITSYTPSIKQMLWLVDGEVMKSDLTTTTKNQESLASSWSFMPFDEDEEIECKVVGDQTLSERIRIKVKKSMTKPYINGLGNALSLESGVEINLTCITTYTPSIESISWLVNGKTIKTDKTTTMTIEDEDSLVSFWSFIPFPEDNKIECKVVGDKTLSESVRIKVKKSMTKPVIYGLGNTSSLEYGVEIKLTCMTSFTPSFESFIWLVNGKAMKSDSTNTVTIENGDKLVSSWSLVPFPEDNEIECKVIGDQTLSERVKIMIKKSMTKPVIYGLVDYSSLEPGVGVNLTCETSNTPSIDSFIWLVNGDVKKTDETPTVKNKEKLVSSWSFVPFSGDNEIECHVVGDKTLSDRVIFKIKKSMTKPVINGINKSTFLKSGFEVKLTCITSYTSSIESFIWLLNGKIMDNDKVPKHENKKKLVSSWSFIPSVKDKDIECQVVGDQILSDKVTIKVKNSMTRPVIKGLEEGTPLEPGVEVNLICTTSYTPAIKSIKWSVNGEVLKIDNVLTVENEDVIFSTMIYIPKNKDKEVKCEIVGDQTLSENISFIVSSKSESNASLSQSINENNNDTNIKHDIPLKLKFKPKVDITQENETRKKTNNNYINMVIITEDDDIFNKEIFRNEETKKENWNVKNYHKGEVSTKKIDLDTNNEDLVYLTTDKLLGNSDHSAKEVLIKSYNILSENKMNNNIDIGNKTKFISRTESEIDEKKNNLSYKEEIFWIPHIEEYNATSEEDIYFNDGTQPLTIETTTEYKSERIYERPNNILDVSVLKQKKTSDIVVPLAEKQQKSELEYSSSVSLTLLRSKIIILCITSVFLSFTYSKDI